MTIELEWKTRIPFTNIQINRRKELKSGTSIPAILRHDFSEADVAENGITYGWVEGDLYGTLTVETPDIVRVDLDYVSDSLRLIGGLKGLLRFFNREPGGVYKLPGLDADERGFTFKKNEINELARFFRVNGKNLAYAP